MLVFLSLDFAPSFCLLHWLAFLSSQLFKILYIVINSGAVIQNTLRFQGYADAGQLTSLFTFFRQNQQ
jgi:hypothetical protein